MGTTNKSDGVNYTGNITGTTSKPTTKKREIVKKSELVSNTEFDLNNDGKVDEKDATIAGKVLANRKRKLKR